MNTSLKKPRRRWLIVALVLLLVGGVTWRNWPRGDARFVGKWSWMIPGNKRPSTVWLDATGVFRANDPGLARDTLSTWTVENELLIVGPKSNSDVTGLHLAAREVLRKNNVALITNAGNKWIIVQVDSNEILLRKPDEEGVIKLTRIPE